MLRSAPSLQTVSLEKRCKAQLTAYEEYSFVRSGAWKAGLLSFLYLIIGDILAN